MINLMKSAAKEEILPRLGEVVDKSKSNHDFKDIVTEADKKASDYILERIRDAFPGSYSEEDKKEDRFKYDFLWQIDPLDGTHEFCENMAGGYACHAALLKKINSIYMPVAGIIYLPGKDKLWFSEGKNVKFEKEGKISKIKLSNKDKIRGWVRKVDPNEKVIEFYNQVGSDLGKEVEINYGGGAGASISDLLEGKTNLIVMNYDYPKEWDLAMAEPIVRAAGGFICDLEGNEFIYNRKDVEGLGEPYNLKGYVISIAFKKDEILSRIPQDLLVKRLKRID